ncbi:hypothetical protein BGW39_006653 [Mortierella sp. 14UC]|nr:hypothetical protein BGW39_006653 [Mortierella sp. 14UC]
MKTHSPPHTTKRYNPSPQPHPNKKQRRLSNRDRFNIIESITNDAHTIIETAKRFKLPESTVRSIYKTFEQTGRVIKLPKVEHLNWIKSRLLQEPGIPISDLHAELNKKFRLQPTNESGLNLHIRQMYGRAPRGARPIKPVRMQKGPDLSLLVALDSTGLIASEVKFKTHKGIYLA